MDIRMRSHNGTLVPVGDAARDAVAKLAHGASVMVEINSPRSQKSHAHQFAWIASAWASIPEDMAELPWAATPETLRKHALIATGYHQCVTLDTGNGTAARRIMAALRDAEYRAHGYAVGKVDGLMVRIFTPESQSVRSMGNDRFQKSKTAILEWIADKIGVAPEELTRAA